MLTPSGLVVDDLDLAPVAARISGADDAAGAVRAVEDDPQPGGLDRPGEARCDGPR